MAKSICVSGGVKKISSVLKEDVITCEMDAECIVEKLYADLLEEE